MRNGPDKVEWLLGLGAAVCLLLAVVYGGLSCSTEALCDEAGYPNSKVGWNFKRYCIKRQDQTDIVVPVDDVQ